MHILRHITQQLKHSSRFRAPMIWLFYWTRKITGTLTPYQAAQVWFHLGAVCNYQGKRGKAVALWRRMMQVQESYARKLAMPMDTKYFYAPYWVLQLGHIALLDYFAKCKELGLNTSKFCIIAPRENIVNKAYIDYWKPWFEMMHDPQEIEERKNRCNLYFPTVFNIGSEWFWKHDAMQIVQEHWEASGRGPLLKASPQHIADGWEYLGGKGMPEGTWFAALHVREGGRVSGAEREIKGMRNASIDAYMEAIETVTKAGGWVLRIGGGNFTPLPEMPQVIDYATSSDKRDWLDIFFLSQCRFAIATNSGPAWVAKSFGTPVVLTNWGPMGDLSHMKNTITLPQLLWRDKEKCFLRFEEQLQEPYGYLESAASLAKFGLQFLPNRPGEIAEGVREMIAMLDSGWKTIPEDDIRQANFKAIAKRAGVTFRGRIGADFLAKHADLLETEIPLERPGESLVGNVERFVGGVDASKRVAVHG